MHSANVATVDVQAVHAWALPLVLSNFQIVHIILGVIVDSVADHIQLRARNMGMGMA